MYDQTEGNCRAPQVFFAGWRDDDGGGNALRSAPPAEYVLMCLLFVSCCVFLLLVSLFSLCVSSWFRLVSLPYALAVGPDGKLARVIDTLCP